ncbi:GntR family transcriptional regulator [Pigmentiphaga sp. H8]|uniref:GntR family transcriptional regulator n=1 Tax=unclassified Pigmentiphaga TaxID=2626614 RepID=UPI000F5A018D|nr:GntR family transcriptional regulator [Pigmentiphaga sp. H8]AZG10733.1 GntR family transcriptional regulator [Pigmentiphaga sp. H8]
MTISDTTSTATPPASQQGKLADLIRARIVSGELGLGQMLSDKELALEYQISRTPVREALLELRSAGLVVSYPQRGTYVFDPSPKDIAEICQMRGLLEAGALRVAAAAGLTSLVMELNKAVAHMAFAIEAGDFRMIETFDTQFHETMVAMCGNSRLVAAYRQISDQVRVLRHRLPARRQRVHDALAQHRRIVDLLTAERIDDAVEEVHRHVERVHDLLDHPELASGAESPSQP